jgi:hypothetical protein
MYNKKKLMEVYQEAKGDNSYYSFDKFIKDAKSYLKDIKAEKVIASMKVSRSGMTRRFNTQHYNMLLNICYNQKFSWDEVKVGGCGMDMWWYLLFTTCERLTDTQKDSFNYNSASSYQTIL